MSKKVTIWVCSVIVVLLLVLGTIYGFLVHAEVLAGKLVARQFQTSAPGMKFKYNGVSYNPVMLYSGDVQLNDPSIILPSQQKISAQSVTLKKIDYHNKTLTELAISFNGVKLSHLQNLKNKTAADFIARTKLNLDLALTGTQAKLNIFIKQRHTDAKRYKGVLSAKFTLKNLPEYNSQNPSLFLNTIGQAELYALKLRVNWPFTVDPNSLHLPPAVSGGLVQMGYQDLPLELVGTSDFNGKKLTAKSKFNLMLGYGFDLLINSENTFKRPVLLGSDFGLLSNPTLGELFKTDDNKLVKHIKIQLIDQGFSSKLMNAIAKAQGQQVSALKIALRSELGNLIGATNIPQVKSTYIAIQQFIQHPKNITIHINPKSPMPASFPVKFLVIRKLNKAKFMNELQKVKTNKARSKLVEEFQDYEEQGMQRFLNLIGYSVKVNE